MDSRTLIGSGRGPQGPAAKLTDFRTSHSDARTHWGRENGDGSLNVHRDPRNPRVKDNRLWTRNRVLNKQRNKLTRRLCRSFKLYSASAGLRTRAEDPVQRKVNALRRGQREATKGERVGRGRKRRYLWAGPVGAESCLPSTPPLSVLGLLVLLSSCASFLAF